MGQIGTGTLYRLEKSSKTAQRVLENCTAVLKTAQRVPDRQWRESPLICTEFQYGCDDGHLKFEQKETVLGYRVWASGELRVHLERPQNRQNGLKDGLL